MYHHRRRMRVPPGARSYPRLAAPTSATTATPEAQKSSPAMSAHFVVRDIRPGSMPQICCVSTAPRQPQHEQRHAGWQQTQKNAAPFGMSEPLDRLWLAQSDRVPPGEWIAHERRREDECPDRQHDLPDHAVASEWTVPVVFGHRRPSDGTAFSREPREVGAPGYLRARRGSSAATPCEPAWLSSEPTRRLEGPC